MIPLCNCLINAKTHILQCFNICKDELMKPNVCVYFVMYVLYCVYILGYIPVISTYFVLLFSASVSPVGVGQLYLNIFIACTIGIVITVIIKIIL